MLDLVRIIRYYQQGASSPPAYIIENVPTHDDPRPSIQSAHFFLRSLLGIPLLIDAAHVGARAHRLRYLWSNLIPITLLYALRQQTVRSPGLLVQDILEPHRSLLPVNYPAKACFHQ